MVARLFSKGLLLLGLGAGLGAAQNGSRPLYKDPNAVVDDRVADLLSRMTIEDKRAQLIQGAFYAIFSPVRRSWFPSTYLFLQATSPIG